MEPPCAKPGRRAEGSDTRGLERLETSLQLWTRAVGVVGSRPAHRVGPGLRRPAAGSGPRIPGWDARGRAGAGSGRGGRSPEGKPSRVRTRLALQNGRTSAPRLTPELWAAAPLPPLPPARSPLPQLGAAAAATAAVILAAHPHRSCSPSGAEPSGAEPRQPRPALDRPRARPRPLGAESPEPPPLQAPGKGGARACSPSQAPSSRAAEANRRMGKGRKLRNLASTSERAGQTKEKWGCREDNARVEGPKRSGWTRGALGTGWRERWGAQVCPGWGRDACLGGEEMGAS